MKTDQDIKQADNDKQFYVLFMQKTVFVGEVKKNRTGEKKENKDKIEFVVQGFIFLH